jgi:hypothetical protein
MIDDCLVDAVQAERTDRLVPDWLDLVPFYVNKIEVYRDVRLIKYLFLAAIALPV